MSSVVGVVGLGNMGSAVAERLGATFTVTGYDSNQERREVAQSLGIEVVASLSDLATDLVVLSLPSPAVSAEVMAQLARKLPPGALVLETSTVNPSDLRKCAKMAAENAVRMVDAAILSGVEGMRQGKSTLLVGGAREDLRMALPVVEAMSARYVVLGELGAGMAAKVVNNAVAHSLMVLLVEAAALARSSGVSMEAITELLQDPEAGLLRPLTHRVQERIMSGDFEGGMPMDAARKDSSLAIALAQELGVPLFAIQASHTPYEIALSRGMGRKDYASLALLWEEWAGVSLRRATS